MDTCDRTGVRVRFQSDALGCFERFTTSASARVADISVVSEEQALWVRERRFSSRQQPLAAGTSDVPMAGKSPIAQAVEEPGDGGL